MLTLITMRHAKSGWDDPGAEDRDRPLSDRGRRDAPRIGQWLHNAAPLPDLILCSSAQRTLETAQAVTGQLDGAPEPIPRDDLYMARSDRLLSVLRAADALLVLSSHLRLQERTDYALRKGGTRMQPKAAFFSNVRTPRLCKS